MLLVSLAESAHAVRKSPKTNYVKVSETGDETVCGSLRVVLYVTVGRDCLRKVRVPKRAACSFRVWTGRTAAWPFCKTTTHENFPFSSVNSFSTFLISGTCSSTPLGYSSTFLDRKPVGAESSQGFVVRSRKAKLCPNFSPKRNNVTKVDIAKS